MSNTAGKLAFWGEWRTPTICGRPVGKHFVKPMALGRLRSYVRPVDAKPQPAGHDDIRVPGFSSAPRARGAGRGSEYPGLRFAGSSSPHFALANVDAVSGETCLTPCR
jgi:hypothetical protein